MYVKLKYSMIVVSHWICRLEWEFLFLNAGKALPWGHWVPWLIFTIVIDHVVHTNPLVPSCFNGVKGLVCSTFPPVIRVRGTVSRTWHSAPFDVEVLVISVEWCFVPIDFLQATPCCPVICFPQCGVHSHGLHLRVWDSPCLVVLVYSDGKIVHVEAACVCTICKTLTNWKLVSETL